MLEVRGLNQMKFVAYSNDWIQNHLMVWKLEEGDAKLNVPRSFTRCTKLFPIAVFLKNYRTHVIEDFHDYLPLGTQFLKHPKEFLIQFSSANCAHSEASIPAIWVITFWSMLMTEMCAPCVAGLSFSARGCAPILEFTQRSAPSHAGNATKGSRTSMSSATTNCCTRASSPTLVPTVKRDLCSSPT
ncbi:hypothetical protein TNCT_610311 [Trichonephila clavata]|uniref:Uncharacterized protein n=1 Tax=Trichonephila clavata TaxID=2740835 RepID=A0A8X6HZ47_TRICU|nr:hypothetical protein TNCT_610311 [Trichonephila clavata]